MPELGGIARLFYNFDGFIEPGLTLPGHPEVFAIGDMVRAHTLDGKRVAPGSRSRHAAGPLRRRRDSQPPARPRHAPFRYIDKGNLATIGRSRAVADVKGVRLSGFLAWAIWLLVHLAYLSGFQNRLLVFVRWTISFLTRRAGCAVDHRSACGGPAFDERRWGRVAWPRVGVIRDA